MQTIEARAILSAADRTGGVFAQIAAKIRGMNAAAVQANRATAMTGTAAAASVRGASSKAAAANAAIMAGAGRVLAPAAAVAAAGKAYSNFADADLAIKRIGVTADASEEQVSKLNDTIRDISQHTGKQFKEVTKGLESLVAGGMDLPEAMPALPAIVKTAQAAGAEVEHMSTTALALNQNLKISTDKMQNAFDILVKGGKAGKFELKDMAQYFPSIAPAAVALGMKGEEGLMRIVAALQTVRAGTGTTEEAASSMQNIFAKMESEETTTRFKKFGIDLRKEMTQARKDGKDLLEVFTELSAKALKGDLSKLPQLFSDMQMARGMRALLSFGELNKKVMAELRASAGSTAADFEKIVSTPAIAVEKLKSSFDRLFYSIGFAIDELGKKLGNKEGTSGLISDLAKNFELMGEGKFGDKARADVAEIKRQFEIGNLEKILERTMNRDAQDIKDARVRLFELKNRPNIGTELDKPLFTEHELSRFPSYLTPEGPEAPPHMRTPVPTSDPRKSGQMPDVQSLEIPPVDVKLEAAFQPAEVNAKVTVEAGSELLKIVDGLKDLKARLQGFMSNTYTNGAGSTGKSSPDAAPGQGPL